MVAVGSHPGGGQYLWPGERSVVLLMAVDKPGTGGARFYHHRSRRVGRRVACAEISRPPDA
jgi:hypothetical protein